jgi:serine/threonine protein kinase
MTPERWQQIERLYHGALEREKTQRTAYLKQACGGDDGLRREVESLLVHEQGAKNFLEAPAIEAAIRALGKEQGRQLIGREMGAYQVLSLLGVGGMGEVYEARDRKLGRKVAIKVLPEEFVHHPERLSRFQREARMLAALNHPNIATIYGLDQSGSVNYLVMELVPGQTLAERIGKGALPVEEALKFACEIAEALEAAHEKGVIHRDLKPANVKVTPEGRVKVLDFGLAKAFASDGTADLSQAPTVTVMPTEEGRILGTPAYMSPEQARGLPVDKRTDIWAFGCVLYEMLTGLTPFTGQTLSDILASVLKHEPDWSALPGSTPPKIRDLLRRCLQKDEQRRLRDISDARIEIEDGLTVPAPADVPTGGHKMRERLAWAVAALTVVGFVGLAIVVRLRPTAADHMIRFDLVNAGSPKVIELPRPSPDGSAIVYPGIDSTGEHMLWLRSLDSEQAKPLPGTEAALAPFWSPDGRWIGFYAHGKVKKVSRDGASVQTIAAVGDFFSGAWSANGEILLTLGNRTPIYRVPDSGGTPQQFTTLDQSRTENSHRWITFLPDGRHFFFLARCYNRENNSLYEGSVDNGEVRRVAHMDSNVAYLPPRDDHGAMLLFAGDGKLFEQAFDGSSLQGEPAAIADVQYDAIGIHGYFALSGDGRTLVMRSAFTMGTRLTWFDRKGTVVGTLGPPGIYQQPLISPDGGSVIFNRPDDNGGNRDIWSFDVNRGIASRLTLNPANEWNEVWSPDGRRIIFASDRSGNPLGNMFEKTSMEPGADETAVSGLPDFANPEDWSADGRWIAFTSGGVHGKIWITPAFGEKKPFRFLDTPFEERGPRFSPDGKWIAYTSNESGRSEVYVRPFSGEPAGAQGKLQISERGGYFGSWSRKGHELFFIGADSKLYATDMGNLNRTGAVPSPHALFEVCPGNTPTDQATQGQEFDVAGDGQKFLFVCGDQAQEHYSVLVNWKPQ